MKRHSFTQTHNVGGAALVGSNILMALALAFMRTIGGDPWTQTLVLGAANLICASLLLGRAVYGQILLPLRAYAFLLLWAGAYCLSYGLYCLAPGHLSLSQLFIAQATAPLLAALVARDQHRVHNASRPLMHSVLLITLLLGIAAHKWLTSSAGATNLADIGTFAIVLLAFITSQSSARILSRSFQPLLIQPWLAFLSGSLLTAFVIMVAPHEQCVTALKDSWHYSILLAAFVIGVQMTFLFGLKHAHPIYSAACISSSVPIAVATDMIRFPETRSLLEAGFSLIYLVAVAAISARTKLSSLRTGSRPDSNGAYAGPPSLLTDSPEPEEGRTQSWK